jgi:hypothetical protein
MASRVVVDESALRLGVVADYGVRTGVKVLVHRAFTTACAGQGFRWRPWAPGGFEKPNILRA